MLTDACLDAPNAWTGPPGEAVRERVAVAAGVPQGIKEGRDSVDRAALLLLRGMACLVAFCRRVRLTCLGVFFVFSFRLVFSRRCSPPFLLHVLCSFPSFRSSAKNRFPTCCRRFFRRTVAASIFCTGPAVAYRLNPRLKLSRFLILFFFSFVFCFVSAGGNVFISLVLSLFRRIARLSLSLPLPHPPSLRLAFRLRLLPLPLFLLPPFLTLLRPLASSRLSMMSLFVPFFSPPPPSTPSLFFVVVGFQGGFTELISTAEKAWTAISKRSPPDAAAVERVKAAVSDLPPFFPTCYMQKSIQPST